VQTAARAAARLGDLEGIKEAVHAVAGQPGRVPVTIRREATAAISILEGRRNDGVGGFVEALRRWRDFGFEFEAAVCALVMVTMLGPAESEVQVAGEYAVGVFERLGAAPFQAMLANAMEASAASRISSQGRRSTGDVTMPATRAE